MKRICLNRSVLDFMSARIDRKSCVLEYGSGWSSRWFANRCGELLSVETHPGWASKVLADLREHSCRNASVFLTDDPANAAVGLHFDLVLVDSDEQYRAACARAGWAALKPGGWLIFDDAQRSRHAVAVEWLTGQGGEPIRLGWSHGDIEAARERLALAWSKPS